MQIVTMKNRPTLEEKETLLHYDYIDKIWTIDTTIMKHYNKAKKQGWEQTHEYMCDDGVICGGVFTAPERAITIRNVEVKQMSEQQLVNLLQDDDE